MELIKMSSAAGKRSQLKTIDGCAPSPAKRSQLEQLMVAPPLQPKEVNLNNLWWRPLSCQNKST